jgi:hypothetical protein
MSDNLVINMYILFSAPLYSGQQLPIRFSNCQFTSSNDHLLSILIKMTHTHNISGELGNEIHTFKSMVLAILADEFHSPTTFNLSYGVITEMDRSPHACVKIDERRTRTDHMICSSRVQDPNLGLTTGLRLAQLHKHLFYMDFHRRQRPVYVSHRRRSILHKSLFESNPDDHERQLLLLNYIDLLFLGL